MQKKLFTPFRVILLISAVCVLTVLSNGKAIASVFGGVFDEFFDLPEEDVLVHVEALDEADGVVELTNEIAINRPLSSYSVVLTYFAFISDRYSVRLMPSSFVTLDIYQSPPNRPDIKEPLAKGVRAIISEDRWLKNNLNGQMLIVMFSEFGNQNISVEAKTIKPNYRLSVKLNPSFNPGFYCLRSNSAGDPICIVKGDFK